MFIIISASMILCGVVAATSDFPDFLLENGENTKESDGSGVRLIANPPLMGKKPCQMDVKIVKKITGYCSEIGLGVNACVADSYVRPFHQDCSIYR